MKNNSNNWFAIQVEQILRYKKISLSHLSKRILLEFSNHCDRDGYCEPYYYEIADACGIHKKNIPRYVAKFKSLKIMQVEHQFIKGSQGMKNNKIHINLEMIINLSVSDEGKISIDIEPKISQKSSVDIEEKIDDQKLSPHLRMTPPSPQNDVVKLRTKNLNQKQKLLDNDYDHSLINALDIPVDVHFEDFWASYPRKEGKQKARAIWIREKLDSIAEEIIDDVRQRQIRHDRWEDRSFIPHPTTYLNGMGWKDEIVERRKITSDKKEKFNSGVYLVDEVRKSYANQRTDSENIFDVSNYLSKKVD